MPDNPIAPLGDLSKPANTLIEKISDAVGGLFRPYQIKRVAKAESEAALIAAHSALQISELQQRAFERWLEEEAKKQTNMENITASALPLLEDNASPEKVDDDWITNFFDKSRIISDEEMQQMWARVLANEANNPGTCSRQTVNILSNMDKRDADLFSNLCCYCWQIHESFPLIFDFENETYKEREINLPNLNHLESLSLVNLNSATGYILPSLSGVATIFYFGKPLNLEFRNNKNRLLLGRVMLTNAGKELQRICSAQPVEGFYEFVVEKYKKEGVLLNTDKA